MAQLIYDVMRRSLKPIEPVVTVDEVTLTDAQTAFLRSCVTFACAREPNIRLNPAAVAVEAMLLEGSPEARRRAGLL
jgi:hypothetical protein